MRETFTPQRPGITVPRGVKGLTSPFCSIYNGTCCLRKTLSYVNQIVVVRHRNSVLISVQGYYERSDDYFPILQRQKRGVFEVPMIHSTYLVDLRRNITSELAYDPPHPEYEGENDDILVFAHSARMAGKGHAMALESGMWILLNILTIFQTF